MSQLLWVWERRNFWQLDSILGLLVVLEAAEEREGKAGFLDGTKWPVLAVLAATRLSFSHDVTTSFGTPVSWFNHSGRLDFYGWTKNRRSTRAISLALRFPGSNSPAVLWKMMDFFFCFFVCHFFFEEQVKKHKKPNQTPTSQLNRNPEKLLCFV